MRTVKGKPLKKVCLGLTFRDICRGHWDTMVVLSQYINRVIYQSGIQSSTYYDRIIWCHYVLIYVSEGLT